MKQLSGIILVIFTLFSFSCDKNVQETTDFSGVVLQYPLNQPKKDIKVILKRTENSLSDLHPSIDSVITNSEGRFNFNLKLNSKEKFSFEISDYNYTKLISSKQDNPIIKQNSINYDTIFICEKSFLKIEFLKVSSTPVTSVSCNINSAYLHFNNLVMLGFRDYDFIPNQSYTATVFELPYDLFAQTKINWSVYNNLDQINKSADVILSPGDTCVYILEF
jgi:5-hydroxyisourate hydrolase-like protein (transthyretin family)